MFLLPIFPLLGVSVWILLRNLAGFVAWTGRVAAFGYMAFYTALDVLAGIGTGELLMRSTGSPPREQIDTLYAVGRDMKLIGVGCFLLAGLATSWLLIRRVGRRALPGAVVLVIFDGGLL